MIDAALAERERIALQIADWYAGNTGLGCGSALLFGRISDALEKWGAVCANEALENVFNLTPGKPNEHDSAQYREGYYAGLEAYRQAIRALKAEG